MDYKSGNHMCVLYYYGRVEPEFYVPLFYVIPVFYVTLSRTKWIFPRISEFYFTGSFYLREKNFGPLGSCKIQVPLYIKLPGVKIAPKIKKRRGDRQKRRKGDGRRRREMGGGGGEETGSRKRGGGGEEMGRRGGRSSWIHIRLFFILRRGRRFTLVRRKANYHSQTSMSLRRGH